MKDFKKILAETERWHESLWNASDFKYTFPNGSQIEFFSADNDAKLRGARRDWLYMNECNNMTFHSYTELASRTKQGVYLDWNPTNTFWFHNELLNDKDVDFLTINYTDNEACPESALNFILKAKEKAEQGNAFWQNWYKVYGLGEIGNLEGVIFNNWQQIDKIPADAKLIGIGCDFGYTNDPTALIEVYTYNGKRYVNELMYRSGMLNSDIAKVLPKGVIVYADSSEPKSIDEIKRYGIMIKGVTKGKDSIKYGIDVMQQQEYFVTSQSENLIKELRSYSWDKDKEGKKLNKPIEYFNHAIDALRYHEMEALGIKKNWGKYHVI
jgi:phage terminase large subunit